MNRRTKIQLVIDIVDYEHRYKFDHLMSGRWCQLRIAELMKLSKAKILERWRDMFVL